MPFDIQVTRTREPKPRPPAGDLGFGRFYSDHLFLADHEGRGWQNPRIVPHGPIPLDPAASALQYAQAMFEGMKAVPGERGPLLFRPQMHIRRFNVSARRLCMPEVPEEDFLHALRALVREDASWVPTEPGASLYVRPTMIGTEAYLGVRPSRKYLLYVLTSPVGNYFGPRPTPLRLWVETEHVRAARGGIGAAKAGANYVAGMAAAERAKKAGFHQVIWLDQNHQHVEEAGTMNVFFRIGDTVVTPPLEDSLLAGVTRDSVLHLLREWKVKVQERPVSIAEVAEASARGELKEAFGTGTAATVSAIGELQWGEKVMRLGDARGEIAERLYRTMMELFGSRRPDRRGWLVPVDPS
ncbi:MAG: branched-chain amino acid aminotransferase [Myxococcaceae bacterium]|nr:MAG: branched-chain amino acid aminotransferase [Myxococcaceae bacterium]